MNQPDYYDPDWALIQAMAEGNTQAMDTLYAKHGPSVLSFLTARLRNRQLAEEILQDVMLAAWKSAPSFRAESKVRTWLLVIARNRAINAQRKNRVQQVELFEETELPNHETGPMERVERKLDRKVVREALHHLPEHQREVLVLTFYHQLTGPEAAELLGVSVGTIKSRLHRAKEMLKRVLIKEDGL